MLFDSQRHQLSSVMTRVRRDALLGGHLVTSHEMWSWCRAAVHLWGPLRVYPGSSATAPPGSRSAFTSLLASAGLKLGGLGFLPTCVKGTGRNTRGRLKVEVLAEAGRDVAQRRAEGGEARAAPGAAVGQIHVAGGPPPVEHPCSPGDERRKP